MAAELKCSCKWAPMPLPVSPTSFRDTGKSKCLLTSRNDLPRGKDLGYIRAAADAANGQRPQAKTLSPGLSTSPSQHTEIYLTTQRETKQKYSG